MGCDRACPFCDLGSRPIVDRNELAAAFRDAYPVNPGHTLVVPIRHFAGWFEATREEREAIFALVDRVRAALDDELHPSGYNLGINVGTTAGQTVPHLHVHVIPRFENDVDDPTGGVRFVIPARGNYRRAGFVPSPPDPGRPAPLATGWKGDPFLRHLAPLFNRAEDIAIIAAFVQDSGVFHLERHLHAALDRGARVRILTGDYLHITQAQALRHLLDIGHAPPPDIEEDAHARRLGRFELRVVEVQNLRPRAASFHPKSWIFIGKEFGCAFVGSSNVSHAALTDGIEWNCRVDGHRDREAFGLICKAYEDWWRRGIAIDEDWLDDYEARAGVTPPELPGEIVTEEVPPPDPHDVQREALEALRRDRTVEGRKRALVVLATGLGKTWLAAFDVRRYAEEIGRMPRVLFLAHRIEILRQAESTFRRLFPKERFGWFADDESRLEGEVVFASVQKFARPANLAKIPFDRFDYVIVDEVHHADAATYRRIMSYLSPLFLLGLTATPERADAGDILGIFDDHVAFEAGIGEGILLGHLVPFRYLGLKDTVDYDPIPWRSGRFDPDILSRAVATRARMEKLWETWRDQPQTRTLVFCCSIAHLRFVETWLRERGLRVASVHSEADSDDREDSLARLDAGEVDAVCAVDIFNEGVDIPKVDRVVMLRPTESPVLFIQQLGRGLRTTEGKEYLQVIDFVGNHRVFLDRVRTLLSLTRGAESADLRRFLSEGKPLELPGGSSVEIELEAIELLQKFLQAAGGTALIRAYRELKASRGVRPTIGELYRLGYNPRSLKGHEGWFEFVAAEGDLTGGEKKALGHARDWLLAIESREAMTKSFKMVALEALLEADALTEGMEVSENARRSLEILIRSPELRKDLEGTKEIPDPTNISPTAWAAYWEKWPLRHWEGSERKKGERTWFRIREGRFEPKFEVPEEAAAALTRMTREIVDYRFTQYRRRRSQESAGKAGSFEAKVITNGRDPILLFDRKNFPDLPEGDTDVRLPDGMPWRFRFVKIACNVAHPVGDARNRLPDLLRRWFGPDAGKTGTAFVVRFSRSPEGWWVEPSADVVSPAARGRLIAYPSLHAAARGESGLHEWVTLPGTFDRNECFAIRATGVSGDGLCCDIRDGDWLVVRWARGNGLSAMEDRVALMEGRDTKTGSALHLARIERSGKEVLLEGRDSEVSRVEDGRNDQPIALLVSSFRPESIGPARGSRFSDEDLPGAFGLSSMPRPLVSRRDGHLFLLLQGMECLSAPDRIIAEVPDCRPAETAFVFARSAAEEPWVYLGVGRHQGNAPDIWQFPEVDFKTWRSLGRGRSASRRIEDTWIDEAQKVVAKILERCGKGNWAESDGKSCRLVGGAREGGLRIDGGPGGFGERTVSLTDFAWVLKTMAKSGDDPKMVPDEAMVNRFRYLDGTPKGSTRWIDTGWARVLIRAVK